MLARTLMVQGTASHVGKSLVTTALCRLLRRRGYRVAPFKAQNMSLNSAVAADGELGRSQAFQAAACGIEPETAMNPILLKPMAGGRCQVIVRGQAVAVAEGYATPDHTRRALEIAADALAELRPRFEVVVLEGMGSPVEINLRDRDGANMAVAALAEAPVLLLGDIERGGVFAALAGTLELLPAEERGRVRGLLINKFHGDPAVLRPGLEELERRYGIPTLGVLPWLRDLHVDEEDAVALSAGRGSAEAAPLDIVAPRLPGIANFTDLAPLEQEPGVSVRYVDRPSAWGAPRLVVLPGSRSVAADLHWLRECGLAECVVAHARAGGRVVGLCGGYQMLGERLHDPHGIESGGLVEGLGLLPLETTLAPGKTLDRVRGECLLPGLAALPVEGYEIHHGETRCGPETTAVVRITSGQGAAPLPRSEGAASADGRIFGTYLHGFFDSPVLRRAFLRELGACAEAAAATRPDVFERLADWLEAHVDVAALLGLVEVSPAPNAMR